MFDDKIEEQHEDNSQQNLVANAAICNTNAAVCDNEDRLEC